MGQLFTFGDSRYLQLNWNSFESGCDKLEPLPDSRQLAICGGGAASFTDSTISAVIAGNAAITGRGYCSGSHRFTFVRRRQ
jgi:hypothetical protein